MSTENGLFKKFVLCVLLALALAVVFTGCELKNPDTEALYYINDGDANYYNQDHTTSTQAVTEFTDSITALRKYLDSESFVDSGYYMGVDYGIDILDAKNNTVGNFALRISAFLYTYPYEDDNGNPIYKYYEDGKYYDENNAEGTRTLVSALEIHNEAIKKSDISIEWYNGATNEVLIGLYFDGVNSNSDNPGNVLYVNVQGYKRSFAGFGDTVLYQQMIRLLVSLSVEGLLEKLGLQSDAGTGTINTTMSALIGENYKRVVNGDIISLLFYSVTLDAISSNVTKMLSGMLGVFGKKWDPMTLKYLGFKFSTVANAVIQSIDADMQTVISPDKQGVNNVLTNAAFAFSGVVESYDVLYTYTSTMKFDYGWVYPEDLTLDTLYYTPFDNGNYEFQGTLYIPSWDAQYDALIRTDIQKYDNSKNNVFIEFRDIANGELMIGLYYRNERSYLDISGLEYMYGWIDLEALGFPQVYDEHLDLSELLAKFSRLIDKVIVSIVDSILDPETSDKDNGVLHDIMEKTSYTEKTEDDIFSINSETLQVDIELIKQMLEETGAGTYSTRQIINILDSVMPYTMDQLAILLGVSSAEVMLEKTYFTLTWNVDTQEMTMIMYTNVGVETGEPSTMIYKLELTPIHFGEYVKISDVDFSGFKPLGEIYTYSGTLVGDFVFSSQETVDMSKLLSATIGESSGLNTPYVLANNAGVSFTLVYDQFVKDQEVDGVWKLAGRSAFDLTVWLTGSESSIIITLCSDDVCFDNDVYKDLPARESELGYIWVNIQCVTKNGVQNIPKLKIREDVFMASMSAYMNNDTSINDDMSSFADNDFNLSLTSIISALCEDAYVVAEPEQLEITSSNETLQNLFRVSGLIGNIKVDAGFTYRVKGLESIKNQYAMYEVGYFDNIEGNSPYDTALHSALAVYFYDDYMDTYDPLKYDFFVFRNRTFLDNQTYIDEGTIMLFKLGARKTVTRCEIDYPSSSFFNSEDANNQDISQVRFLLSDLPFVFYDADEAAYRYYTYTGKVRTIEENYVYVAADGTVYIYWLGVDEVLFHESDANYYYYDRDMAVYGDDGEYVFIYPKDDRDLLFEYDADSVKVTEACKTQYAPRTNGSFMGQVRRYFVTFETVYKEELGSVASLYHNPDSVYPQYYCDADENNVVNIYDDDGVLISSTPTPITLYVMEPCEELATEITVVINTSATTTAVYTLNAEFVIDWDVVTTKGYMTLTDATVAPGMMGEVTFPVRIIVVNREIDTDETATVYPSETSDAYMPNVPVVDEISVDPYDYIIAKYAYLSSTVNFNPGQYFTEDAVLAAYGEAVQKFIHQYFAQKKFAFTIEFAWEDSYLYAENVDGRYIAKSYDNYSVNSDGTQNFTAYDWNFDTFGNNLESAINENGGTIYVHTYFKGQLIALAVNVGKREFSYIKFGESDDFDSDAYNGTDVPASQRVNGVYRGNYYDSTSYKIGTQPIFVFVDGSGNEFEYVFDMAVITGLVKNADGTYGSTYVTDASYEISWGHAAITNVSSDGSYYGEYTYTYLYSETFTATETGYSGLTGAQKALTVSYIAADGTVHTDGYYYKDVDGKAYVRSRISYADLQTVLADNGRTGELTSYVSVDYGSGKAYKFTEQTDGVTVRSENTVPVNRPFYYFTDENGNTVYLTEEQYTAYLGGDKNGFSFNTDTTTEIATTTLDLAYLLRLFFTVNGGLYTLSVVGNSAAAAEDGAQIETGENFSIFLVKIVAECPELEIAQNEAEEKDELTGETFRPDKVDAGVPTALGYYNVDPLDSSYLTLPDSLTIYFTDGNGRESSHVFKNLVWGASFDSEGNPVFTYTDLYGNTQTLIKYENGRYVLNIDLKEISGTLKFRTQVRIGNAVSGYKNVTVCVSILSKDPTDVAFYTAGNATPLDVRKTVAGMDSGAASAARFTYYTYYANTFSDLKLPSSIQATFSDGHKQTYAVSWEIAGGGSDYVFAPDTLVNLVCTIGTAEGIEIDIYFCVVVENYSISDIDVSNDYADYYVTMQNTNGQTDGEKTKVGDLLHYDNEKIGYYRTGSSTYYVRISSGENADGGVAKNMIGLYTYDDAKNEYSLAAEVGVYEFIETVFAGAKLSLGKASFDYDKQTIIDSNSSIFDYSIRMYDKNNTLGTVFKPIDEAAAVGYSRDNSTGSDVVTVSLVFTDAVTGITYLPSIDANGNVVIENSLGIMKSMSWSELLVYIISESEAKDYTGWNVKSVNGNKMTGTLSDYVMYGSETGLSLNASLGLAAGGTIILSDPDGLEDDVEFSYGELVYRLNGYYEYIRVTEGAKTTVKDKSIAVNDIYVLMDVSDMIYRAGLVSTDKYTVSLGATEGSYDLRAQLIFCGGYYVDAADGAMKDISVQPYSSMGEAQYASGYSLGNNVTATLTATLSDGSDKYSFKYNISATDAKLTRWYVESSTVEGVEKGSVITSIPAAAIYATGSESGGAIEMSALTEEGFRIRRRFVIESLPERLETGFGGTKTGGFTIDNGTVTVENIYEYTNPSVYAYLGTADYLPTSLAVTVNGRQITVSGISWKILSSWYGGADSTLSSLDYKGTSGSAYMAEAKVLGYTQYSAALGQNVVYGQITLRLKIVVDTAEVLILPWENTPVKLVTETQSSDGVTKKFIVYTDVYEDAASSAITAEDTFELPSSITVRYTSGAEFSFDDVVYKYNGSKKVTLLYFDTEGINIEAMTASGHELAGVLSSDLSRRYIDLTVSLGLGQTLDMRFYFYDKTALEVTRNDAYSYEYYYKDGNAVKYSAVTDAQRTLFVTDDSGDRYYMYISDNASTPEEGYAKVLVGTYTDMSPVIELDDADIRSAILENVDAKLASRTEKLYAGVNRNRVVYNLELLIKEAGEIKGSVASPSVTAAVAAMSLSKAITTEASVRNALLSWETSVLSYGTDPAALPTDCAYSEKQSYDYAAEYLKAAAESLADTYVKDIIGTITGDGSETAKRNTVVKKAAAFVSAFTEQSYNAIIKNYLEKEYSLIFGEAMNNMTSDEYDYSVYYKNMVEAGFDADAVVKTIGKLRDLNRSGTSAALALEQIDVARAEKNGFPVSTYDELAAAVIVEAVYDAYDYAGGLMGLTDTDGDGIVTGADTDDENLKAIISEVSSILEKRLDFANLTGTEANTDKNSQYSIAGFIQGLCYNFHTTSGENDVTKKYMRAYLINIMSEAMDFTEIISVDSALWNEFTGLKDEITNYSFNSIPNYDTTVRSIRRSLISASSIDSILGNLIKAGISNFVYTVYGETLYATNIKNMQKINGITVSAASGLKEATEKYTSEYYADPYYDYCAAAKKIIVYFDDGNAAEGDTGGYPYVAAVDNWTVNEFDDNISYAGCAEPLVGNIVSAVTKESTVVSMYAACRKHILGTDRMTVTEAYLSDAKTMLDAGKNAARTSDGAYFMTAEDGGSARKTVKYYSVVAGRADTAAAYASDTVKGSAVFEPLYKAVSSDAVYTAEYLAEAKAMIDGGKECAATDDGTYVLVATGGYAEKTVKLCAAVAGRAVTAEAYADDEGKTAVFTKDFSSYSRVSYAAEYDEITEATSAVIENATLAVESGADMASDDGRYFIHTSGTYAYVYAYVAAYGIVYSRYSSESVVYSMTFKTYSGVKKLNAMSGFDSDGDIMYTLTDLRDEETGAIRKQSVSVYNPFEFSQTDDLPSQILVDGQLMDIEWKNAAVTPAGNTSSGGTSDAQKITGTVKNADGQSVSMYLYVAQWNYAGLYQTTDVSGGISYDVNGETYNFVKMNPLAFYFSAYMDYSARDFYLADFTVSILVANADGTLSVKQIVFKRDAGGVSYVAYESGFIKKVFYPEDSRLLEYGTDDATMKIVDVRAKYVIYWDETQKNKVINSGGTVSLCSIYLGNDEMGTFGISGLRASSDTGTPVTASYSREDMNIDSAQFVTNGETSVSVDGNTVTIICENTGNEYILNTQSGKFVCCTCGKEYDAVKTAAGYDLVCETTGCSGSNYTVHYYENSKTAECDCPACLIYREIKSSLTAKDGQITVAMNPNTYYPTTGLVNLFENNVSYAKEKITVRLIWNVTYDAAVTKLKAFVAYAYPDVEESAREAYAINILMTWNEITEAARGEIISCAQSYNRSLNSYTGSYTERQCLADTYKLLAINEQYDYSSDTERLKGGANNSVRATVLVKIGDGVNIYRRQMTVKVVFGDFAPCAYYSYNGSTYTAIESGSVAKNAYAGLTSLYIAVRTEYWDGTNDCSSYVSEGKDAPYDNISALSYKILQLNAYTVTTDTDGNTLDLRGVNGTQCRLVRVSDIVWNYDENTNIITSESFSLGGITYNSDLLKITLG